MLGLPNVIGVVDCTHIRNIQAPTENENAYGSFHKA